MWVCSVWKDFRNLRRAGTLKNKSRTSKVLPVGKPISATPWSWPPATSMQVPTVSPSAQVFIVRRETAAIDGMASPRNPYVEMRSMSSTSRILLVACGSRHIRALSRSMPQPLSATEMSLRPPAVTATSTRVAPASRAFSKSSLRTDAGRSTTSPAAILFATLTGRRRICLRSAIVP